MIRREGRARLGRVFALQMLGVAAGLVIALVVSVVFLHDGSLRRDLASVALMGLAIALGSGAVVVAVLVRRRTQRV